jgi:2-polyprenyl-3-methyl-5-hydroxy-6-metoxy-1,4-benzoquinol methylase
MHKQQIDLMHKYEYEGKELELFADAVNWKKYWYRKLKPLVGKCVLEVGAGIGGTAKLFANCEVNRWLALDADIKFVSHVKEDSKKYKYPSNFEILHKTSSSLRLNEKFDTILYIDVLEHIQDDQTELNNISKLLKPGGRIIILSPAHDYLFTAFDKAIGHFRRYNKIRLLSIMPKNMKLETAYYLDSVGMLASLGNRFLLKSAYPTASQIQFWDKFLIPVSIVLDKISYNRIGKSIIVVFKN